MSVTPIAPTYLAGKGSSILVTLNTGTTGTPVNVITPIPVASFSPSDKVETFDATNSTGQGYEDVEASSRMGTFTFEAKWKKSGGAPAIRLGAIYFFQLNTQTLTGVTGASSGVTYEGWSGNALVIGIDSSVDVKGEVKWTGKAQWKGVYNSPDYPTAIADASASPPTGDFVLSD